MWHIRRKFFRGNIWKRRWKPHCRIAARIKNLICMRKRLLARLYTDYGDIRSIKTKFGTKTKKVEIRLSLEKFLFYNSSYFYVHCLAEKKNLIQKTKSKNFPFRWKSKISRFFYIEDFTFLHCFHLWSALRPEKNIVDSKRI